MKALINANIYDFMNFQKNKYILFDNKIEEIGDMKDFKYKEEAYDCKDSIVMQGL